MGWFADIFRPGFRALFDQYASMFSYKAKECDVDLFIDTGGIVFKFYGSEQRKNEAWQREHAGSKIYFACVSSKPVEIWGDVRKAKNGALIINPLSLGHEVLHALRVIQSNWNLQNENEGQLLSPDKYTEL